MDQVNATIDCDVGMLNIPLRPMFARVGHNFVARFRSIPADVTGVFVRIFRPGGSYFDVTAKEHLSGEWSARVSAACFVEVGESKYEVHATSADDEPCAIGQGRLCIAEFSTTTAPNKVGAIQKVAELPCEGGGFIQVVMKWDGFAWVPEAVASASATTED